VGTRDAVGEIEVVTVLEAVHEPVQEGVEHELALDAEQVECARAVLLEEGARRRPVLAQHQLVRVAGAVRRVGVLLAHLLDQRLLARPGGGEVKRRDALAELRIGERKQPVRRLHDVGIGVVNDASFDVGQDDASSISRAGLRFDGPGPV
jgi:hypothetical protein